MIFDFAKITGRGDEREMGTGSRMLLTRKAHSSSKVPFFLIFNSSKAEVVMQTACDCAYKMNQLLEQLKYLIRIPGALGQSFTQKYIII